MGVPMRILTVLTLLGLMAGCGTTSPGTGPKLSSDIRLAPLFTDHLVLQRNMNVPVWGWAAPGDRVEVSMNGSTVAAKANKDGKWIVELPAMTAGGPYSLEVKGNRTLTLNDVLVGDVWLASGQSNMWWPIKSGELGVANRDAEVAAANYPNIRLFTVPQTTSLVPRLDIEAGDWAACTPETAATFSAVAYFFGREMHAELGVPIGLIHSSWGGTLCEAWTSERALQALPDFAAKLKRMEEEAPHMEKAEADYQKAMERWNAKLASYDRGHEDGVPLWASRDLSTEEWNTMPLPGVWENQGYADLDGFMWYRKVLELPEAWRGKDLTLSLGPINDMDRTFFNGDLVGKHEGVGHAGTFRNYTVPGRLVVPHVNVVAIRVYDMGNLGGVYGNEQDMYVTLAGVPDAPRIPLAGVWQHRPSAYLRDIPARPAAPLMRAGEPNVPTVLYNAMIAPLVPYGITGAIWYQGESNAQRAFQYRSLFPAMIEDWRGRWGQGDFPFVYVQLANFFAPLPEPAASAWAELREAQDLTLRLKNTGMATIIDIGEAEDIHPQNKQDVGKRLSLVARRVAHGESIVYSGPRYKSHTVENGEVRIEFDHPGGGLVTQEGAPVQGFTIAGSDQRFVWGEARIEGASVVVRSDAVAVPKAVRYAWADNPVCNLYNKAGLPAAPFRTDTWPGITVANN
jgi:sialate O-acetylesterase